MSGISARPPAFGQLFSAPTRPPSPVTLPFPAWRAQDGLLDGARAPRGLRRALICARGESQQCADLPSSPLAESRSAVWQVLGDSRMHFLVVCGCAKGAWVRPEKDNWSTRVAVREPPEAPRLLFSSQGSHNILDCSVFYASVMVHRGPLRGALNKMLGSLHGSGASCARIMPKCWL